jgi:translation initiation factor 1
MGKHRHSGVADSAKPAVFKVNPFAVLKVEAGTAPAAASTEAKPTGSAAPASAAREPAKLSAADRELLRAFAGATTAVGTDVESAAKPPRGRVRLQVQRKGRGGKTVTRVLGLETLDLAAQMELARTLRQALGIGAHFEEGALELHGDMSTRATEWFRAHGYRAD